MVDGRIRKPRTDDVVGEVPSDIGDWLGKRSGNRVRRVVESPGSDLFGKFWLKQVFEVAA